MKSVAAAIDFGTSKIVTLLAESGGFNRCDIIGSGTVPYDGYAAGKWNAPEELAQAVRNSISAAELEGKTRIRDVYVGVPCEFIRVVNAQATVEVNTPDGRITEAELSAVQDAAADQLQLAVIGGTVIHRSTAWFSVNDGKKTWSPVGLKGNTLSASVSFILADPVFLEDVTQLLTGIGIGVLGFLSPSMGESLLLLTPDERDRVAVLIDVGYLNAEFSVLEGDAITYHAVIPMGGGHITADLAAQLEIPMRAAEQIKREYIFMPDEFDPAGDPEVVDEQGQRLTFPRKLVQEVIETTVNEFVEMVDLALRDCQEQLGDRSQIYVIGGGIVMMRGGREYLSAKLGRPVKLSMVKAAKLNSPGFASAQGLIDLVFDSIEQRTAQDESLPGRLAGGIRGLFGKR